jgi:hypothetical protein
MKKGFRSLLLIPVLLVLTSALSWAADAAPVTSSQPAAVTTPAAKAPSASKKKKAAKAKYVWVCPMGDYTGTKPGKCPNCGMDLVKQKVTDSKPATTTGSGSGM